MTEAAIAAIEGGAMLWRLAEEQGLGERLVNYFRKKERVIVLGLSGTGKTNLLTSLSASAGLVDAISADDRTTQPQKHNVLIQNKPFIVIDTPGEEQHKIRRREAILDLVRERDTPLRVINVVSYGYHEYGTGAPDALTAQKKAKPQYLERHRQNEIDSLAEWIPMLGDRSTTKWILTVVTKADLWWGNKSEIVKHYEHGAYARGIRATDEHLHHVVLPYCSVVHKFYGTAPISGEFDDAERIETNMRFLQKLVELD